MSGDLYDAGVVRRWLDATGTLSSEEYLINRYEVHNQLLPQLAYGNGSFVAVWQSWNQDGAYTGVYLRHDPPGALV